MAQLKCGNCGAYLTTDDRYCQSCGENNSKFIDPKESSSNQNQQSTTHYSYTNSNRESSGVGWFFLGLFFPLVGFILYFTLKNDKPTASSMSAAGAWVGLFIAIVIAGAGGY
jgi:RNA polymerase subunit RPABC4/transcription elongation factor Spt4